MIPKLSLESNRLFIRPYKLGDAYDSFHLVVRNKEALIDYFPMTVEHNTSVMAKRQYILERNIERKNGKSLLAGIFLKENNKLIGQVGTKEINWRVPKCEMGYFIDREFYGKGIATEACTMFLAFCFEKMKMQKILLRIEPANTASKMVAKNCGFEMIGVAKNDFRGANGRLMDCELWEKIS